MMNLQVGVKAFLRNKDGKYMLLHRSLEKYKGTKGSWDIVGGRIDPGSSLLENLKREITEETRLKIISEPKLICAQDIILTGKECHIVRLTYTASADGEPILDTSENVEFRWLNIDDLKKQEDLDIYVKEILERGLLK
jgi:ADP-ribose pyrophosphatase YjhB (NUDIX family)